MPPCTPSASRRSHGDGGLHGDGVEHRQVRAYRCRWQHSVQRSPDDDEVLAGGVLAPVEREVDTARRLLREAASGHRAPAA
jgi:hypothetical protein